MSPIEILLQAAAEKNSVAEVRKIIEDHGLDTVMRHYERLQKRKTLPKLSTLMSYALGFRVKESGSPLVTILFAQPVILDLTDLKETIPSALPSSISKVIYGLYGLPASSPLIYSNALLSPHDLPIYNAQAVDEALENPPQVPFTAPGFHFRFFLVKTAVHILSDIDLANPRPLEQLFKTAYKAKRVVALPPTEVFNLWLLYDRLNK